MTVHREVLKPADVAPLLGVTTWRIYQLIAAGDIPAIRLGGALRIPRTAWEAWIAEQSDRALAAARRARRQGR